MACIDQRRRPFNPQNVTLARNIVITWAAGVTINETALRQLRLRIIKEKGTAETETQRKKEEERETCVLIICRTSLFYLQCSFSCEVLLFMWKRLHRHLGLGILLLFGLTPPAPERAEDILLQAQKRLGLGVFLSCHLPGLIKAAHSGACASWLGLIFCSGCLASLLSCNHRVQRLKSFCFP